MANSKKLVKCQPKEFFTANPSGGETAECTTITVTSPSTNGPTSLIDVTATWDGAATATHALTAGESHTFKCKLKKLTAHETVVTEGATIEWTLG